MWPFDITERTKRTAVLRETIESLLEETVESLKQSSFEALTRIPDCTELRRVQCQDKSVFVRYYKIHEFDDRLMIGVQVGYEWRIISGWTGPSDGFWMTADGAVAPLTEDERFELD